MDDNMCYLVTKHIKNYLSQPVTQEILGVDDAVKGNFSDYSSAVNHAFAGSMDLVQPTYHWVGALLERGIRALIYVGEYDWICNWIGNAAWVDNLEWSGGEGYRATPQGTWTMGNETVGRAKTYEDLTFVTIRGAGHLVSDREAPSILFLSEDLHRSHIILSFRLS
jgi:carboxypeptidase C (cathepsin A)